MQCTSGETSNRLAHNDISSKSPYEAAGFPKNYKVTMKDFTTDNLHMTWKRPLPDLTAGLSYGGRFFNERLGIMLAGSYLNTYRGKESRTLLSTGENA